MLVFEAADNTGIVKKLTKEENSSELRYSCLKIEKKNTNELRKRQVKKALQDLSLCHLPSPPLIRTYTR